MDLDVEKIIQSIKQGDQDSVQSQLHEYNNEYAECFFFDAEERERRKQQELEEFRRNKVREYVPNSDSDFDSDGAEDPDISLRQRLAAALIWFIRTRLQPLVLKVCLRTLRILSRDKQALGPLITDTALLTLARLGGITMLPLPEEEDGETDRHGEISATAETKSSPGTKEEGVTNIDAEDAVSLADDSAASPSATDETKNIKIQVTDMNVINWTQDQQIGGQQTFTYANVTEMYSSYDGAHTRSDTHGVLIRGKKDNRAKSVDEDNEQDVEGNEETWRKEAMKALCNIIYNSHWAQERASELRLLSGLSDKLTHGIQALAPSSVQFYELRLLFLLTALRPELRKQLQQEGGVSMLTAALEQCLSVQWKEPYEVLMDPMAPPVSLEVSERAVEILKTLFNITHSVHKQELDSDDAALYRHLAAILRHCLLLSGENEERTEEVQGHTVNLLSALPLQCLDVLLSVPLSEGSLEWEGINMDSVQTLLFFTERQLDRGIKLKEKLTPVLNLLTESSRVHRGTRHYLRHKILPPLRDVVNRPEQGATVKSKLVRLMTHVDTDIKHCAADLLFVLCKENVSRFVKYTGYGNAAGLLAARGLLSGKTAAKAGGQYSSDSDSDTEEYKQAKGRINPVTGRVEEDQPDPMEGMTEEEKEAEAERLISMFNRLSHDKIIEPMGVTPEGKLAPLSELKDSINAEESESEGEGESESDRETL